MHGQRTLTVVVAEKIFFLSFFLFCFSCSNEGSAPASSCLSCRPEIGGRDAVERRARLDLDLVGRSLPLLPFPSGLFIFFTMVR